MGLTFLSHCWTTERLLLPLSAAAAAVVAGGTVVGTCEAVGALVWDAAAALAAFFAAFAALRACFSALVSPVHVIEICK